MILLVRTVFLYICVMAAMRIMGKRQIGELQPSELVVTIMISEVASIPMQNTGVPLISGIIPVLVLLTAEVVTSFFSLKNRRFRRLVSGYPSILIEDGQINQGELKKLRFSVDDLLEELRVNNCDDISDVAYAILETGGRISIITKTCARGVTVRDMELNLPPACITYTIISDGHIDKEEMHMAGKDIPWLKEQLKQNNINSHKDVFLATIDSSGSLFVRLKDKRGGRR